MKNAIFAVLLSIVASSAFAWGSDEYSAGQYSRGSTLGSGRVYEGFVVQVRRVALDPSSTAQWTARSAGGAIGGAIANQLGSKSSGAGRFLASTLGAIGGAVAGDMIVDATAPSGQEVVVKTKTGDMMVIVQGGSNLEPGQPILIVEASGRLRAVPDTRYQKGSAPGM